VSSRGKPIGERSRVETPHPATPKAMTAALLTIVPDPRTFDRISVGFPGVVHEGVVRTAPNLDPSWVGFDLEGAIRKGSHKPTRVLNDAGVWEQFESYVHTHAGVDFSHGICPACAEAWSAAAPGGAR